MDILLLLLMLAVVGIIAKFILLPSYRKQKEQEREEAQRAEEYRRASAFFRDDITQEQFVRLVKLFAEKYRAKRLDSLEVVGHKVIGRVTAVSGITVWMFRTNYDSYGHLSSEYSLYSENDGSLIPRSVAEGIAECIRIWGSSDGTGWTREEFDPSTVHRPSVIHPPFCPYCGNKLSPSYAHCPSCGKKIPLIEP